MAISSSEATLPTTAGIARALREGPLGKLAILIAILLVAFLASKSCASSGGDISQEEAVEIAREEIDYEPDDVLVRFFRQGVPSRPFWAVSLSKLNGAGMAVRRTLVVVSAATGEVQEVQELAP